VKSNQNIPLTFAILAICFFFLLIIFGDKGWTDMEARMAQKERLQRKNTALEEENADLYREVKRLKNDPQYLEEVARKELGMVGKNEQIFKVTPLPEKKKEPGQ
jgi:cell division protein FtsB